MCFYILSVFLPMCFLRRRQMDVWGVERQNDISPCLYKEPETVWYQRGSENLHFWCLSVFLWFISNSHQLETLLSLSETETNVLIFPIKLSLFFSFHFCVKAAHGDVVFAMCRYEQLGQKWLSFVFWNWHIVDIQYRCFTVGQGVWNESVYLYRKSFT